MSFVTEDGNDPSSAKIAQPGQDGVLGNMSDSRLVSSQRFGINQVEQDPERLPLTTRTLTTTL
jgi:hypothetical protein